MNGDSTRIGQNSKTVPNIAIRNSLKTENNLVIGILVSVNEDSPNNIIVTQIKK